MPRLWKTAPTIRRTRLFAWTVSVCLIASAALATDIETIEGSATWDGTDPVPRGAVLEVDLIDLTRSGDGAVLSRMRFKPDLSTPLPFLLHYDADLVRRGERYSLAARLVRGEDVLYRSRTPVPVLRTFQPERPQITMHKVVPVVAGGTPVDFSWAVASIAGAPILRYARAYIAFREDGSANGSFGCNKFKAAYTIDGSKIEFKRFQPTNRGCTTKVANQERAIRSAIRRTVSYERDGTRLVFLDVAGLETLSFERQ